MGEKRVQWPDPQGQTPMEQSGRCRERWGRFIQGGQEGDKYKGQLVSLSGLVGTFLSR